MCKNIVFISVVRDIEMYNSFVKNNPCNSGAEFVMYNNNLENVVIPKRYNDFLENYDYKKPAWFVFCHEDWQTKTKWLHKLKKLDKKSLYGICGTKLVIKNNKFAHKYYFGQMMGSDRRGMRKHAIGTKVKTGKVVETFDCMCLIVHSSLIEKYHIRFDEKLTWHLYTEEMCISLKEKFNILSRILQIDSQHWSWGEADEAFDKSFDYLTKKFRKIKNPYSITASNTSIRPIEQKIEPKSTTRMITLQFSIFGISLFNAKKYVD